MCKCFVTELQTELGVGLRREKDPVEKYSDGPWAGSADPPVTTAAMASVQLCPAPPLSSMKLAHEDLCKPKALTAGEGPALGQHT